MCHDFSSTFIFFDSLKIFDLTKFERFQVTSEKQNTPFQVFMSSLVFAAFLFHWLCVSLFAEQVCYPL